MKTYTTATLVNYGGLQAPSQSIPQKLLHMGAKHYHMKSSLMNSQPMQGLGKLREAAFQRWLKSEKKVSVGMFTRKRLIKMQKSSSGNGITFEMWIEFKRKSHENVKNGNIDSKHSRKQENIKHGITFGEWKRWKNEQRITTEQENSKQEKESITDDDNTKKRNQNTFEKWLQKKE